MMAAGKARSAGFAPGFPIVVLALGVFPGCRLASEAPPHPAVSGAADELAIDMQTYFGATPCPRPRIDVDEAGAHVSIAYADLYVAKNGQPVPGSLYVVSEAGVCPSVERRSGEVDPTALTSLLRRIAAARPGCPAPPARPDPYPGTDGLRELLSYEDRWVVLAAAPDMSVRELAPVGRAAAAAKLSPLKLAIYEEPAAGCAHSITPEFLHGLDALPW